MSRSGLEAAMREWRKRRATMGQQDDERLWKKLRLEWNYNSNHIEGNTLTYDETALLLIFGRAYGGHPMQHYEEMKAHDAAIEHVRRLANEVRTLGEGDTRDLNKILLKESFWNPAETADGHPTRRRIVPGVYKRQPNHVTTATGELHRFAEPEETPALMRRWTRDFRHGLKEARENESRLPLFLARSHSRFLQIHPFDDGNGRTARLLTNYVLLRHDLPPLVIKSAERDRYIGALQNTDVGRMEPLEQFMSNNMIWALGLGIRAAKGESLREAGDSRKEVELFARKYDVGLPAKPDVERLNQVFHLQMRPVLEEVKDGLSPLSRLFARTYWGSHVGIGNSQPVYPAGNVFTQVQWEQTKAEYILTPGFRLAGARTLTLRVGLTLTAFVGHEDAFSIELQMTWKLDGKGVDFTAGIDGESVAAASRRVRYAELDVPGTDPVATVICHSVMKEIDRRTGG